jgi:hypothetical protein
MTCQQQKNTSRKDIRPCYLRNPIIVERSIDDTVFLVNPETDNIFYLNQVGTAIWQLLTEPINVLEAVAIVQQAFPDVQPNNIAEDVSKLINEMSARNLVLCGS